MPSPSGRPRQGRPPRISADSIARTVVDVGFRRASITTIARELNVSTSALYGHYPSRDAMVGAAAEAVLGSRSWPTPDTPWRSYVTDVVVGLYELSVAHPGLAAEATAVTDTPPTLTRLINDVALALLRAGLDETDAILAANTALHLGFETLADHAPDPAAYRRHQVHEHLDAVDARLRGALVAIVEAPPRESLLRSLAFLLDGIAVAIDRARGDRSRSAEQGTAGDLDARRGDPPALG